MAKKVLIADTFGNAVNWGFSHIPSLSSSDALLTMLAYTFQIYFDFSGYCDMATGIGLMMNIELPQNFNSPYRSLSITEFWKRWHMTLTRFFTHYIYIPLGGQQKRCCTNLPQYPYRVPVQWNLAWCQLDIHPLGRYARYCLCARSYNKTPY